jgi:hypothetical protein
VLGGRFDASATLVPQRTTQVETTTSPRSTHKHTLRRTWVSVVSTGLNLNIILRVRHLLAASRKLPGPFACKIVLFLPASSCVPLTRGNRSVLFGLIVPRGGRNNNMSGCSFLTSPPPIIHILCLQP